MNPKSNLPDIIDKNGLTPSRTYTQPYRITFARWNYTSVEKKVLTAIIGSLQKEIALLLSGKSLGQLDMFNGNTDTVKVEISYQDILDKKSTNQATIKKAVQDLRNIDVQIVLPAIKGKKDKKPREETILTGLIERAVIEKFSRTMTIYMHRATAIEMVNVNHGFTKYLAEVIMNTSSKHTQRLYEYIMHWKDQTTYRVAEEQFRKEFFLEDKYERTRDLITRVIKPAQKEILESNSPIYFEFSETTSKGSTTFNFIIKNRAEENELQRMGMLQREQNKNMLKTHFQFDSSDLEKIRSIIDNPKIVKQLTNKILDLHEYITKNRATIIDPTAYVLKAIISDFENEQ